MTAELYNDHKFSKKDVLLLDGIDNFTRHDLDQLAARRRGGVPEAILSVCVSTTAACNIRCWYCYALENKKRNKDQLTAEEYKSLIDQAVDLGARTMIVCGDGEPTYDSLLTEAILPHGRKRGLQPVVVTNGTVFGNDLTARQLHGMTGRDLTKFIADHGASLLVKLETLDGALYEQIVQKEGAWGWFMQGLDNIMESGFAKHEDRADGTYTRLSFTGIATKENYESVPAMKKFARDHGAQYICKVPSPTGGALDHVDTKLFAPDVVAKVRKEIDLYTDKRETLTPIILDGDACMTCLAWHLGPVISETGYYVECYTSTADKFGSIREKSLAQLLRETQKDTVFDNPCPIKDRLYAKLTDQRGGGTGEPLMQIKKLTRKGDVVSGVSVR